jgi:hypothetical protein
MLTDYITSNEHAKISVIVSRGKLGVTCLFDKLSK